MLILVARYTFFFWIFIGNSNAERLFLQHIVAVDEELFRLTACTARCLYAFGHDSHTGMPENLQAGKHNKHTNRNFTLEQCFNECSSNHTGFAQLQNVERTQENLRLKLVCRDDRNLHFRIDREDAESLIQKENLEQAAEAAREVELNEKIVYYFRISKAKDPEKFWVYLADENFISFGNLSQNCVYNITAVAVHANNRYSVISKVQQFKTLQFGYVPGMVTDMRVINYSAMPEALQENRLTAHIMWRPSADMTCHYHIICFSTESAEYDIAPLEIRNPRQLYNYAIENLTFAKEYKVGIRAKNTKNESNESEVHWMTFRAPSCVEYYDYNFQICPPPEPEGLQVEKTYIGENIFALNISWQLPQYLPDYYELKILDLTAEGALHERNVSKFSSNYFFDEITLLGFMFEVHLVAYTAGGNSSAQLGEVIQSRVTVPDHNDRVKLISAIFAPIFCIVLLCLTTYIICHRRAKLKRYQERCKYFEELEKKAPIDPRAAFDFPTTKSLPRLTSATDLKQFQLDLEEKIFFNDDAMEIERNDVTLHEILGEGAFGLVRRGVFRNNKSGEMQEVAVKMLKEQPSADDVRAFRREIEVMKSVEQHPNIVSLIGHCTKRFNEMLLLTEYCSLGNLLDFLRDEWKYLHEVHLKKVLEQNLQLPKKNEKNLHFNYNKVRNMELITQTNCNQKNAKTFSKLVAFNKSYGYEEICNNACKCQVEVIRNNNNSLNSANSTKNSILQIPRDKNFKENEAHKISIKNCECQQQRQQQQLERLVNNNQRNALEMDTSAKASQQELSCVDNKSYFKCIENQEEHLQQQNEQNSSTPANSTSATNVTDISDMPLQRQPLSAADLLDIAKQVAIGMEFLAKNKVVHRDLAARNILVATDRTVKIADFGLSRDIYQENIYKKTGNGKLPIKWLALESMTHQVYTTQSDVWSYGILLYEIVTLGGTPYPAIPTNRLLHMLKTGYRMEKPKNCGDEFYNLMTSCWHGNPGERPTFTEIIKWINKLMCDDIYEQQIETATLTMTTSTRKPISKPSNDAVTDDAYLKPL